MKALVSHAPGPLDSLVVEDVADPLPGPGQVLVRVEAAALNFPDVLFVTGEYQVAIPRPFVPGSELAGVVERLGDGAALRLLAQAAQGHRWTAHVPLITAPYGVLYATALWTHPAAPAAHP